jgi:DNA replication and repair protein RecF
MYLQKLSVNNFKNYTGADFLFSENVNCFIGNNGVGKTNLLDAIHYLSFCKSYFTANDMQNIRHGQDFFAIHGTYHKEPGGVSVIQCIQERNKRKRFLLNKKEYDRFSDHIGQIPLVMISPYDRDLINEGSEMRRKYIDSVISQFDKLYLDDLINYNKALLQRNSLLKMFAEKHSWDTLALEIWDEQLVRLGEVIHRKRKAFLEEIIPLFEKYFRMITGGSESVFIEYQTQLDQSSFREKLAGSISNDKAAQYTTVGIHKDDLGFLMDGFPIKKFGSQGQQKSFVIALKLAQFEYTRKTKGFNPVLLLDDIFDKLDDARVQELIRLVSEHSFGQVFITDTSEERILKNFDHKEIDHRIFRLPETSHQSRVKLQ